MSAAAGSGEPAVTQILRAALLPLAARRQTITYRELAALAGIRPPHSIHKVTLGLEALLREDHDAGRPLLAALATSRATGGLPGRGFFELLRSLACYQGPDSGVEASAFHRAELERVWHYWGAVAGGSATEAPRGGA